MARTYRLAKRAERMAQTRQRILEAAGELYQEQGISLTSMQEVARRAEVSPATVLNHFPSATKLARAVVAHWTQALGIPTASIFAGLRTVPEKVERLSRELATFYERSEPLYQVHMRERDEVPALRLGELDFYRAIDQLIRQALGPLGADERVVRTVTAVASPSVYGQLTSQGMTAEEAGGLVAELLAPWLEKQRTRARRKRAGPRK